MSEVMSLLDIRVALITKELEELVSESGMPVFTNDGDFDHRHIFARLCSKDVDFYLSAFCPYRNAAYIYAHNNERSCDSDFGVVVLTPNIIAHYCNYGLDIHDLHLDMSWKNGISLDDALKHDSGIDMAGDAKEVILKE